MPENVEGKEQDIQKDTFVEEAAGNEDSHYDNIIIIMRNVAVSADHLSAQRSGICGTINRWEE